MELFAYPKIRIVNIMVGIYLKRQLRSLRGEDKWTI